MAALGLQAERFVKRGHVIDRRQRHVQLLAQVFQRLARQVAVFGLHILQQLNQRALVAAVAREHGVDFLRIKRHDYLSVFALSFCHSRRTRS
jgi:hypothetical protein